MKKVISFKMLALLVIALLSLSPFSVYGQKKQTSEAVIIYAIEIPGLHQSDGQGAYDKILSSLGLNLEIIVVPPKRAFNEFTKKAKCCISPANIDPEFYDWKTTVKQTEPLGEARIYIFSPDGKPTINKLSALKDKNIGIRMGMPYGKTFDEMKLNASAVSSIELNIRKLDMGRIDYMLAYVPDAYDAFKNLKKAVYPHDKKNPIAIHYDRLVCKGVSDEFIKAFNEALKKYTESNK